MPKTRLSYNLLILLSVFVLTTKAFPLDLPTTEMHFEKKTGKVLGLVNKEAENKPNTPRAQVQSGGIILGVRYLILINNKTSPYQSL